MNESVLQHIRATGMDEKKYNKIKTFVDKILDEDPKPDVNGLLVKFAKKCYASYPQAEGIKQAKKFLQVLYKDLNTLIAEGSSKALSKAAREKTQMRIVRLNKPIDGFTKKLDKYLVGETIGKGATSKVKLGRCSKTGKNVAIKILTADSKAFDIEELQKEIDVLKALKHENIIRLFDCFDNVLFPGGSGKNGSTVVMILELATKGELFDFFMHTGNFEPELARWFFAQMVAGIEYCHKQNIAHRDLKPENVLLGDGYLVKLVDFGFARTFADKSGMINKMTTALGTPGYAAPEILKREKYNANVDIFSLGVILFICIAGFPPFQEAKATDWWFDKLMKKKYALFWKAHERTHKFSDESKDLLVRMLAAHPGERITWEKIRAHAWVQGDTLTQANAEKRLRKRKSSVDKKKIEIAQKEQRTVPKELVRALEMGEDANVHAPKLGAYLPAYHFYTKFPAMEVQEMISNYITNKMMGRTDQFKCGIWVGEVPESDDEGKEDEKPASGTEWEDLQFSVSRKGKTEKKAVEADSDELPSMDSAVSFEGIICVRETDQMTKEKEPINVVYFKRQRGLGSPGAKQGDHKKWNAIVNQILDNVCELFASPDLETFKMPDPEKKATKLKEIDDSQPTKNPFGGILPGICCSTD